MENHFCPANTTTTLYINSDHTFLEALASSQVHFGADLDFDTLHMELENIETFNVGCNCDENRDWITFLVVTLRK